MMDQSELQQGINMHEFNYAYDLGLLAKGLLAHTGLDDFALRAPSDPHLRRLAGAIEKAAASSTDNDLANFTGESPAFLATLHNSIIDSMQGFRLAPARVRLF